MRIIGMDIHRVAAEVVALCEGELTKLGRVPMLRDRLEAFARTELTHDDHVVIEIRRGILLLMREIASQSRWQCCLGFRDR